MIIQPPMMVRPPAPVRPPAAPKAAAAAPPVRTPAQPIYRGQSRDDAIPEAPPAASRMAGPINLAMPSPESLGIASAGTVVPVKREVDWATTRRRLEKVGAISFNLEKRPGGWRFVCAVPGGAAPRQFEAEAASEADAIDQCLTRAEER